MLWECSAEIAGALAALEEPGAVVGIAGVRSFGLVAALTGAVTSGYVVLPIDAALPSRRKRQMLGAAEVGVVVVVGAETDIADWIAADEKLRIIRIDPGSGRVLTGGGHGVPRHRPGPDDPAYVFFTSGTTGKPKAILGRHVGLSRFLVWQRETFSIGPDDRCAQTTSFSFDVVMRDVFLPLVSGASLCLAERIEDWDGEAATAWLAENRITAMHAVPARARSWIEGARTTTALPDLRWVFFAGEPLRGALVRAWRGLAPSSSAVNLYGPTECTLASTYYVVPDDVDDGVQPIGRPLPGTHVLVMSSEDRRAGIGEPGEIVIRTPYRSLGYLNEPMEETARFVPNP